MDTVFSEHGAQSYIYVQLNRTQSVVHNRRSVRLVGAQLYPRVACPVDMVHGYSRVQSVRAQSAGLNQHRTQSCGAQSIPSRNFNKLTLNTGHNIKCNRCNGMM